MTNHVRREVSSATDTRPVHHYNLEPTGTMITVFATFWLFVSVKTSDADDLQVQTVKRGENVTIKCDQNFIKAKKQFYYVWYKQRFGKLPQFIVRSSENSEVTRFAKPFQDRFSVLANEEKFYLNIMDTVDEDTGTYYCVRMKEYVTEFGSGIILLFTDETSKKSDLTEVDMKSGESVKLQCSVATLSCSGEHSVYWFRAGSGESHPGIIYTHGNRSDECKKSSETDSSTQSCVYKLPKRNLSLSDAGTYYCAVAACGQILLGNGTKLSVKGENIWIVPALATTNMISVIVIVVLTVLLLKSQRKGSCKDNQSHTNQVEDTDALNYAALNFAKKPPPSRTSRANQNQDIYSQVKVR